MSVNPDDMDMTGAPTEYVDLEHQVIRQKVETPGGSSLGLSPGEPGAEFSPGERELDREEVAQLVYYRRYAYANFEDQSDFVAGGTGAIIDASVGINGDLFRETTTQTNPEPGIMVDSGGEIGLLDNYTVAADTGLNNSGTGAGAGGFNNIAEFHIDYYDWPTGGPIVDSFDTITCGFGSTNFNSANTVNFELRYDFYWDVREQGRTTNPFGRPSVR